MANAHSIEFLGLTFGPDATFGPATLKAMFGNNLPAHMHPDRSGSVPAAQVIRYLKKQGQKAIELLENESLIIEPGTKEALEEFHFAPFF